MSLVWDSNLESSKKFVLLYYADRAGDEGENSFPAISTVMKKTGYSETSVHRIVRNLVLDNLLIPCGKSDYGTVKYRLNLELIASYKPQEGAKIAPPKTEGGCQNGTGGVPNTHEKAVKMAPNTSLINTINNHHITLQEPEKMETEKPENLSIRGLPTAAVKRGDFLDAMLAFQGAGGPDVGHFPEEVREYIGQFARSWAVDVPRKIGKGDEFSAWIKEGRLLVDACREFGPEAIREAHDVEFMKFKFTVGRPRAILSVVRAAVTRLRESGAEATTAAQLEIAAANPLATYDPAKVAAFQSAIRGKNNSEGD
jgi:hypothetical protein